MHFVIITFLLHTYFLKHKHSKQNLATDLKSSFIAVMTPIDYR